MVDESSEFGACWKNGASGNLGNPSYIEADDDNDRTNIIGGSNYESGVPTSSNTGSSASGSSSSSSAGSTGSYSSSSGSSTVSTGTGVIGMHINSINKIVYFIFIFSPALYLFFTISNSFILFSFA